MYITEVGIVKLISEVAVPIYVSFARVRDLILCFVVIVLLDVSVFARSVYLKRNLITRITMFLIGHLSHPYRVRCSFCESLVVFL